MDLSEILQTGRANMFQPCAFFDSLPTQARQHNTHEINEQNDIGHGTESKTKTA